MKLKPMADNVLLKEKEVETTISGIVLATSNKEKPAIFEVVAVGPGIAEGDNKVVMEVKVGDKVITSKYAGTQVKIDGEELTIVKQNDILAVVE